MRHWRNRLTPYLLCLVLPVPLLTGCSDDDDDDDDEPESKTTASYSSDVAVQWFDLLYDSIQTESLSPPVASRRIGYMGVTLYNAVVGGMPHHRSLAGQVNGLAAPLAQPKGVVHWPSVANAALADAMEGLFAGASNTTLTAIADLEAALQNQYSSVDADVRQRSRNFGASICTQVMDCSAEDGFTTWNNCAYTPPVGEGLWVPTPPAFAPPLQPCWGKLRPFVLLYGAECVPLEFPPYSTDPNSEFYAEGFEVYDTVNNLTAEQLEIAQFWADNPGATGTPPGHWISIVGQVAVQEDLSLATVAEAYARVGLAVADAFISCWEIKYYHNLLRPITYIQDPAGPINDPAWTTPVTTPPFPEFTSGHSVQSGAAATILEDLLGNFTFVDDTHSGNLPARTFDSFEEAAQEAAISRLYGGIHYRSAIERGVEQGKCIARTILDNVEFRR